MAGQPALRGTVFQIKVWKALKDIPRGEVRTYSEIARQIGHPKSARAVANACAKNPYIPEVPCHRVVRTDGGLGGYSGPWFRCSSCRRCVCNLSTDCNGRRDVRRRRRTSDGISKSTRGILHRSLFRKCPYGSVLSAVVKRTDRLSKK